MKSLKAKRAERKRKVAPRLREIDTLTDRGRVMAQLARKIARGSDAIYHGTRHLDNVLRCGKLIPPLNGEPGIFLSRSPEAAAYFASLLQTQASGYSPGVLVLNRRSLTQSYRLEPSRYDVDSDQDEREEVVWDRIINVRRHLLGVVWDADVDLTSRGPENTGICRQPFLAGRSRGGELLTERRLRPAVDSSARGEPECEKSSLGSENNSAWRMPDCR